MVVVESASDDPFVMEDAMTLFLILGIAAGLYMLWLLFTLAIYALPLYAGMTAAFWAHSTGSGILASLGIGVAAAIATLLAGQILFQMIRSPILRTVAALVFAIPAGIAGYSAVDGIASLGIDSETWRHGLAWVGAIIIAVSAWTRLAQFGVNRTAAGSATLMQSPSGVTRAGN